MTRPEGKMEEKALDGEQDLQVLVDHLQMMLDIIESRDKSGVPTYRWPMSLQSDYFTHLDPASGQSTLVWSPVRMSLAVLLMRVPLRFSVAKLIKSNCTGDPLTELYFDTKNGTSKIILKNRELIRLLCDLRDFQERCNPSRSKGQDSLPEPSRALFCDAASRTPFEPLTDCRIQAFLDAVQIELESRLIAEGKVRPGTRNRIEFKTHDLRRTGLLRLLKNPKASAVDFSI